jgi:hypothetical protein
VSRAAVRSTGNVGGLLFVTETKRAKDPRKDAGAVVRLAPRRRGRLDAAQHRLKVIDCNGVGRNGKVFMLIRSQKIVDSFVKKSIILSV